MNKKLKVDVSVYYIEKEKGEIYIYIQNKKSNKKI